MQGSLMAKRKSKTRSSRSTRKVQSERVRRLAAEQEIALMRNPNIDDAWEAYRRNGYTDSQIRAMVLGKMKRRTRKIDGKRFIEVAPPQQNKEAAEAFAQMIRERSGANARLVQTKRGWSVFSSQSARQRSYNASLDDRIAADEVASRSARATPKKDTRNWLQRLTTRRRKTGLQTRTQELDAIELDDFKKYREKLLRDGKTEGDAYNQAKKAAEIKRQDAEKMDGNSAAAIELKKQLRVAKEREDIANYRAARESYNEGVPLSTVAKYNSLEIATTGTGLAVGAGLAATSIATAGVIPIAAVIGFFGAKAIRNNPLGIDLKRGVNRTLDAVDNSTTGIVESVRVSKDNGQPNILTLGLLREPSREKPRKPKSLKQIERESRRNQKREERQRAREIRKEARKMKESGD
jgi:hypothetical protein